MSNDRIPQECGKGWQPLIETAYEIVNQYPCLQAAQVKEKYGELRFYVDHDIDCLLHTCKGFWEWDSFEKWLGPISSRMCEYCGALGETKNWHGGHYIKTLCVKCAGEPLFGNDHTGEE